MPDAEGLARDLVGRLRPVEVELARAWWTASTRRSSADADRRKADLELSRRRLLADHDAFTSVQVAQTDGATGRGVTRQLDLLHDAMLPNQVPEELARQLVELETEVEATFTSFRAEVDGETMADNAILEVLRTSEDGEQRRRAWEASKQVGAAVAGKVRDLARLRNEAARRLGARDHFALSLAVGEMDEGRLLATLTEVDRYTATPFRRWKDTLDEALADRFGVARDELAPWHLDDPFFQDPPRAARSTLTHCSSTPTSRR